MELWGMIDAIRERGVKIAWCNDLGRPGVWVATAALLVLDASSSPGVVTGACRELLSFLAEDHTLV